MVGSVLSLRSTGDVYNWRKLSDYDEYEIFSLLNNTSNNNRYPNPNFNSYMADEAAKLFHMKSCDVDKVAVYRFNCVKVLSGTDFILENRSLIHSDFIDPQSHTSPAENFGIIRRCGSGVKIYFYKSDLYFDHAISLFGQCNSNYAHWLTESLTKLALINKIDEANLVPILIEDGLHPNIYESLKLISGSRKIIRVSRWSSVNVNVLYVATPSGYERYLPESIFSKTDEPYWNCFSGQLLGILRKDIYCALNINELNNDVSSELLFVSRSSKSGNLRALINAMDIENASKKKGLTVIQPELMSFIEQVNVFSGAKVVVCPIGAALVNMIFAKPGIDLVVLSPYFKGASFNYYNNLATALGHNITYVLGRPSKSVGSYSQNFYTVCEGDYDLVLSSILHLNSSDLVNAQVN